ncbi:hypothetical protein [Azospirillum largimobile]
MAGTLRAVVTMRKGDCHSASGQGGATPPFRQSARRSEAEAEPYGRVLRKKVVGADFPHPFTRR